MENKHKHLEFIQAIINRHNSNSFMLKGWTIAILSAILAFAGTLNNPYIVLIAFIPIMMFWGLDAFYLSNERCFIDLYTAVSKGEYILPRSKRKKDDFSVSTEEKERGTIPDFSMDFERFEIWTDNSWRTVLFSKTIKYYYISLLIVSIIIFLGFLYFQPNKNNIKANNINTSIGKNIIISGTNVTISKVEPEVSFELTFPKTANTNKQSKIDKKHSSLASTKKTIKKDNEKSENNSKSGKNQEKVQ